MPSHRRHRHVHRLGGSIPANAEGAPPARSFHHGSMANALPQAIGAQFPYPQRQVVAFCGDGLGMLMGDLTLAQYDLPIKIVVFNNSTLGMVKLEMMVAGFLISAPISSTSTLPRLPRLWESTPCAEGSQE